MADDIDVKRIAAAAEAAFVAGDFKEASRLRQVLHEAFPERLVTQAGAGKILFDGKPAVSQE